MASQNNNQPDANRTQATTFCRICEASCGLVAELEDGKIVDLAPNKDHIGTLGFSCMKGLKQHKMYDSPDRLLSPLKKVGDQHVEISWQQALSEIGSKVKQFKTVSPQSIAMYVGTAAGFSILHPIFAEGFMQGLGSRNIFSSSTQDCANRFASASAMYGFPFFQPFPDLSNINYLMIIGTNPVVSKWTFLQVAHPVKRLKEIKKRGGKIAVVDPRYNETAKVANQHQFIQPNSDVYFFTAFLHEIFARRAVQYDIVEQHMHGIKDIEQLVAPWSPERCSELTDIAAENLRAMVDDYLQADGAAIVTGTGLGMGKNGTIAHWLAEVINAVTGNLDKKGGTLVGKGIFDFAEFAKKNELFNREHRSRIGGFRELNGGLPGGILADEILTPGDEQIKALFVSGGNPLLTMANGERLKQAFESLDMLVVTDIYMNETASLADYVLPATSPLQRPDLPFIFPLFMGMQSLPYLSATEAIVEPQGLQRDEASIYFDLAEACGINLFDEKALQLILKAFKTSNAVSNKLQSLFKKAKHQPNFSNLPNRFILDLIVRLAKVGSFKELVASPEGKKIDGAQAGSFLSQRPLWDDKKVRLAPTELLKQAQVLEEFFQAELELKQPGIYRLISKRVHSTHNSWTQNIDELNDAKTQTNYLYMHPKDAEAQGLSDNSVVDIESKAGVVRVPIKFNRDLKPGSVALQHGWGHQGAKGLSVASKLAGVNVNILASDGPGEVEAISGMAHLSGIPVRISASQEAIASDSWSGIKTA